MENELIHFEFRNQNVQSIVGDFTASFKNVSIVNGPNSGQSKKALDLSPNGRGVVDLTGLNPNSKRFCLQITFFIKGPVNGRQNIAESTFLPFALFVDKGSSENSFELISSLRLKEYGWRQADTKFKTELKTNRWYTASIVYDYDTLGLFLDEELISVHGFPNGIINTGDSKKLFFGTWTNGSRFQLKGKLHSFKWFDGIPNALESLLDEQRSNAEWHITFKHASLHGKINTGERIKGIQYNNAVGSFVQFYQRCGIMFHERVGRAFEMHGSIFSKFKSLRNKASELGYLVSDESISTDSRGRKSLFSKGGIYWSNATGAIPVSGEIYLEYENLGEAKKLGFPKSVAKKIPGGVEQIFQHCRMYYKYGTAKAYEVHGAILSKFIATGGIRKWGFPVTNESDVIKNINNKAKIVGKFSEFEGCTVYWKSGLGAFEVHGSIRKKYELMKGPLGKLGFPTSDESDIPDYSGRGRINSFEKGCINWYGSWDSIKVALPFKIRLQRIHSRENEGVFMGENDIHFYATIKEGSNTLYNKRHPSNGDYGDHNVINPNITFPVTITPNKITMKIGFGIDIRDSDPGNDDHLGKHTTILSAANAWGYNQTNLVFDQSFSKIKSFLWSIRPQIDISSLSEDEKWWEFDNFRTPKISKNQYAAAFRDVDSETELWDLDDGLKNLYYNLVVKGVASGGNCFGMALEAIYALKNNSLFNQPLENVVKNNTSINEINIKHTYQIGAKPIWWFVGQFLSGNTHDPKDVFIETRNAHRRGDNPVICLSQNYNFSGKPHCIMPYDWDDSGRTWKILVQDPSTHPNTKKTINIDSVNNTFQYNGASEYSGGAWSGGRLHYMPFGVLDSMQRTPVWDAIMLILSGTILILADDSETVSIEDENGNSLDGNGERAKSFLKSGNKPEEFFTSFVGFNTGTKIQPGQLMLRQDKYVSNTPITPERLNISGLPLGTIALNRRVRGFTSRNLPSNKHLKNQIKNRTAHQILNDPSLKDKLSGNFKNNLNDLLKINRKRNFVHKIKGAKRGKMEYLIKNELSSIKIESTIQKGEVNTITTKDLNTNACSIDFQSPKTKRMNIEIANKLGVNGDHINLFMKDIPIKADKPFAFNVKSGLSGIELDNPGMQANIPIRIKGIIDGKRIDKQFNMPFDQAARIKPSTILNSDQLVVSKISNLFGNTRGFIPATILDLIYQDTNFHPALRN
ncbi:LGFP repeat-containing protein [Salegentibacter sp. F14]